MIDFGKKILNSLLVKIFVINKNGDIISINNSCQQNFENDLNSLIGTNYLEVCKKAKEKSARDVYEGITGVLEGRLNEFHYEYPCETSEEEFWFLMQVTPLLESEGVVIVHLNITERKLAEKALQKSEEAYRKLIELSPDGIWVHSGKNIVFANTQAAKMLGFNDPEDLIGRKTLDLIHPDYHELVLKHYYKDFKEGKILPCLEIKFKRNDGKYIDGEIRSSFIFYQGKLALQCVIRDITKKKKELERAALIQKRRLGNEFPLEKNIKLETIYFPANEISGDFYHFAKINDYNVLGLLGDVSGKGISAALSTIALKILFNESIQKSTEPMDIVKILNKEVGKYLEEEYVAVCCFNFNFKDNLLKVVGGGINQFCCFSPQKDILVETIKGPFLGMVENKDFLFEQKIINFAKGDIFYFFSDGFENLFKNKSVMGKLKMVSDLKEQKNILLNYLSKHNYSQDDATCLLLEII